MTYFEIGNIYITDSPEGYKCITSEYTQIANPSTGNQVMGQLCMLVSRDLRYIPDSLFNPCLSTNIFYYQQIGTKIPLDFGIFNIVGNCVPLFDWATIKIYYGDGTNWTFDTEKSIYVSTLLGNISLIGLLFGGGYLTYDYLKKSNVIK